jgi:2-polyprenyl-3-methyl-5-hydroxy-6-metoxy-1,4-benzoquinol methylase
VFTDVSNVFLRHALARFGSDYKFVEYALLNIDADPRLQGFALAQYDIIIATNVLHATPSMQNTLHNIQQLLCSGGILVANEAMLTNAFAQITFGMTDGWWLFSESRDAERVGQVSHTHAYFSLSTRHTSNSHTALAGFTVTELEAMGGAAGWKWFQWWQSLHAWRRLLARTSSPCGAEHGTRYYFGHSIT